MADTHYHYARGRRKEAIATVRLYPGKGEIVVGDKTAAEYFNNDALVTVVEQPSSWPAKSRSCALACTSRVAASAARPTPPVWLSPAPST
jgi:ribosomal protein S9